ncbi:MAG TPA: hypothetical protein DEB47_07190 [Citreicella sp.]|nr:hypothetical protein [Citreicella sp.]
MAEPARQHDFEAPAAREIIDARDWERLRYGWAESVRRDHSINVTARLVGQVLAFDFANHRTMQCNPSLGEIGRLLDVSEDTAKRAVAALVDAGWIVRVAGVGRGRRSGYAFLTRARVVPIKGGKSAPIKGGTDAPLSGSQKGANLPVKGGKSASRYNIAKPYKNHRAADPAKTPSTNPLVIADAERAVARFRDGRSDALADLQPWVLNHILAADLLSLEERQAAGFC